MNKENVIYMLTYICNVINICIYIYTIMLSKINQTEKDKYCVISLICGILKKPNSQKQRVDWWSPGAERQRKRGDASQRVQTSSYKVNKFWGSNVQYGDYS